MILVAVNNHYQIQNQERQTFNLTLYAETVRHITSEHVWKTCKILIILRANQYYFFKNRGRFP